jgi:hypothetical protein
MAQLIKPGSVKIITNEGEVQVSITLELNINLNTDSIKVVSQQIEENNKEEKKKEEKKKEEKNISDDWLIPDFGTSPKLNFGKKE